MDLLKLIAELRTYRAQVEEAITAMKGLARRRESPPVRVKRAAPKAAKKAPKSAAGRPVLLKRKRRGAIARKKSR